MWFEWVNLSGSKSKRGGKDGFFSRAPPSGNPWEQPFNPKENPVLPDYFIQIYNISLIVSVLALLKCMDGSVLAFLKP